MSFTHPDAVAIDRLASPQAHTILQGHKAHQPSLEAPSFLRHERLTADEVRPHLELSDTHKPQACSLISFRLIYMLAIDRSD